MKYELNSIQDINFQNMNNINRDSNLVTEARSTYQCPVTFGVYLVGVSREIILSEEHKYFRRRYWHKYASTREARVSNFIATGLY